jgi:hypothetical protein
MPHSMVLAEPIGLIAGIVAGRVGGRFGRYVAQELGVPTWIGGLVGAAASHYLSAAVTKAIINTTLIDPVGGTANVTVTSPLTSVAHGLFDALTDAIPDLGGWLGELLNDSSLVDAVGEFLSDALPTTSDEVREALAEAGVDPAMYSSEQIDALTTNFSQANAPLQQYGESVTMSPQPDGYYQPYSDSTMLQAIADSQGYLPICGLENVENMIQVHYPGIDNALSNRCIDAGWLDANGHLPMERYQPLLQAMGVPSQWIDARDFQTIFNIVSQPGCAVGVYGDAFYLDQGYQINPIDHAANPAKYFHAITLTEPWVNGHGEVVGFVGLDSNRPGRLMFYSFEQIWKFVEGNPRKAGQFAMQALATLPG